MNKYEASMTPHFSSLLKRSCCVSKSSGNTQTLANAVKCYHPLASPVPYQAF